MMFCFKYSNSLSGRVLGAPACTVTHREGTAMGIYDKALNSYHLLLAMDIANALVVISRHSWAAPFVAAWRELPFMYMH